MEIMNMETQELRAVPEVKSFTVSRVPVVCPDGRVHVRVSTIVELSDGSVFVMGMYPQEAKAAGEALFAEGANAQENNAQLETEPEHFDNGHVHDQAPNLLKGKVI